MLTGEAFNIEKDLLKPFTSDSFSEATELIELLQFFTSKKWNWNGKFISKVKTKYTNAYELKEMPKIKHINVGERKGKKLVCVIFEDGSHILKECDKQDDFDIYVGVALCLAEKYYSSNTQFKKLVQKKLTESSKETLEKWKEKK